jgi:predicted membrane-bound spermidine synthase
MSYFIIFLVGFLSGFELPCLFSLSEDNHGKVLAFDYVGMLSGSLFFPLVGLPILGTAGTALVISIINLITIVYIRPFETKIVGHSFVLLNILFLGLIFYSREFLNDILTSIYLIGV